MDRDWMLKASCRNHPTPDIFFPSGRGVESTKLLATAATICMSCPVIEACDAYRRATGSAWGVWGGDVVLTHRYGATGRPALSHGTEAGYQRHRRNREKPCHACTEAQARAGRLRRDRRMQRRTA